MSAERAPQLPSQSPATGPARSGSPFSRRAVAWIVGVALGSALVAVLFPVIGADLTRPPTADPNTYSYSALGHRGLVELLQAADMGVFARQVRAGIGTGPEHALVLAEPDPAWLREDESKRLPALVAEARRRSAPLVLVLPKWRGEETSEGAPGWLLGVAPWSRSEIQSVLDGFGEAELAGLRVAGGTGPAHACRGAVGFASAGALDVDVPSVQLLAASAGVEPVVTCDGGLLVAELTLEEGPRLVVVSDPDLLNNHGLGKGDHAGIVIGLLAERLGVAGVVFDETIHGYERSGGLLAEAVRFPLVLALAQGLLLLGIVLWAGMGRFGKPLPVPPALAAGKSVLIDNTALLLAASGHASDTLRRYYEQTVRALGEAYSLPGEMGTEGIAARLDAQAQARGSRLSLAATAREIQALGGGDRSASRALDLARRLYRFRGELGHGA